jgi:hypothetical protein
LKKNRLTFTFTFTILIHAVDQAAFYDTTLCHLPSHRDYESKCRTTGLF